MYGGGFFFFTLAPRAPHHKHTHKRAGSHPYCAKQMGLYDILRTRAVVNFSASSRGSPSFSHSSLHKATGRTSLLLGKASRAHPSLSLLPSSPFLSSLSLPLPFLLSLSARSDLRLEAEHWERTKVIFLSLRSRPHKRKGRAGQREGARGTFRRLW